MGNFNNRFLAGLMGLVCGLIALPLPTFAYYTQGQGASSQYLTQANEYRKAAKAADKAADTHDVLWKVWAGVGAVCTAICGTSLGGTSIFGAGTDPYVCPGAVMAGSITDAAMTKEFTTAIMGIMGAGMSLAMMPEAPPDPKPGEEALAKKPAKNWAACMNAALAIMQVFMKRQAMDNERVAAKQNRKNAEALEMAAKNAKAFAVSAAPPAISPEKLGASASSGTSTANTGGAGQGTLGSATDADSSLSSKTCSSGANTSAAIQCARANDPNLPDTVDSPNFNKNFKKLSGMDFGKFLKQNSGSSSKGVQTAVGGSLTPAKSAELTGLIDRYERKFQMLGGGEGTEYAGGGGGGNRGGGGDSEEINPQAMIEGMLDKLLPKDESDSAQGQRLDGVEKANRTRSPASIAEDSRISLFDRVSYRYQSVVRRILLH